MREGIRRREARAVLWTLLPTLLILGMEEFFHALHYYIGILLLTLLPLSTSSLTDTPQVPASAQQKKEF